MEKLSKKDKIKHFMPALYTAFKEYKLSARARVMLTITVVYALSPIDLIPDFIPIIGCLDDLFILPIMISLTVKCIPKEIMDECLEKTKNVSFEKYRKRLFYAVPVIIIWVLIVSITIKLLFF